MSVTLPRTAASYAADINSIGVVFGGTATATHVAAMRLISFGGMLMAAR